jgi:hypothetical protein
MASRPAARGVSGRRPCGEDEERASLSLSAGPLRSYSHGELYEELYEELYARADIIGYLPPRGQVRGMVSFMADGPDGRTTQLCIHLADNSARCLEITSNRGLIHGGGLLLSGHFQSWTGLRWWAVAE